MRTRWGELAMGRNRYHSMLFIPCLFIFLVIINNISFIEIKNPLNLNSQAGVGSGAPNNIIRIGVLIGKFKENP